MKKLAIKSICAIFAVGGLFWITGCNRQAESPAGVLGFNVNIESVEGAKPAAMTRASGAFISKSQFATNDQIGLWVVPYSFTSSVSASEDKPSALRPISNYLDNVLHIYASGAFTPAAPIFYPNSGSKVDLYAVFPYNDLMSNPTNNSMTDPAAFGFAISQDQSAAGGADVLRSDLMTAFYRGAKQGNNGTLTFHHRMSRVLVAFNVATKYKEKSVLGVKNVILYGIPLKSFVNIVDTSAVPVIDPTSNPKVEITAYQATKPDAGAIAGAYQYEAVVTPGASFAASDVIVKVTLQVEDYGDVEFMCKTQNAVTYKAKTQTNISVDIMAQSQITFATVSIQGWGTPIDVPASTSKMSNMIIKCVANVDATINTAATKGKLTIEGEIFDAVALYDATLQGYRLQYDHKDNFGGYLTAIELKDAAGNNIFTSATLPVNGLQIKGDPTSDSYATIIGTMTFNTDGTVAMQ